MTRESTFQTKIIKYLESQGAYVLKYNASGISKTGVPDLIACVNGVFVAIEVKAPNGVVSKLQEYNLKQIHNAGGVGLILYPKGFDEFKKIVTKIFDEGGQNGKKVI